MDIGFKIKELRMERGLTQEELADRAELSKGFISQVENNLTSPSIATLTDILQCLGTDLKDFFNEKNDSELKNSIQWIIPNAQKNTMEPILLTLEQGGSTYPDNPHEGEEFGYVLKGSVEIHIGGKIYKAKKGESFYYEAKYSHHIESKKGATIIWVSSPPSF